VCANDIKMNKRYNSLNWRSSRAGFKCPCTILAETTSSATANFYLAFLWNTLF